MVDAELKKAFTELKVKSVETTSRINGVNNQIEQAKNRGKHAELTLGEIRSCSEDTVFYESLGRMFVLESREVIMNQLSNRISGCKDSITKFEEQKSYLSKNLKESENAIRELIESKKNLKI